MRNKIRVPREVAGSTDKENPVFSLRYLQPDRSLHRCDQEEKAAFADSLYRLSRLTWGQINNAPRHGLGYETISRHSIKAGIPAIITPEIRILSFRCHGIAPMVGFRDGAIFHVVWLDRDFTLYDHG